jgi:hypothetical protein
MRLPGTSPTGDHAPCFSQLICMRALIKQYPYDLALHIVHSAAVWAFPLIAIYLLGMGVAWTRVGFRKEN